MNCFLCSPDPELVYAYSDRFFAMTGWGPIGEGYSLIAAREHVPSMMDLSTEEAQELADFTSKIRDRIEPLFGGATITVSPLAWRPLPTPTSPIAYTLTGLFFLDFRRSPLPASRLSSGGETSTRSSRPSGGSPGTVSTCT
jgi:hypothetical protein